MYMMHFIFLVSKESQDAVNLVSCLHITRPLVSFQLAGLMIIGIKANVSQQNRVLCHVLTGPPGARDL